MFTACRIGLLALFLVLATVFNVLADEVIVTSSVAKLMDGRQAIAEVRRGQRFEVIRIQKPWYLVRAEINGKKRNGWLHENNVRLQRGPQLSAEQKKQLETAVKLHKDLPRLHRQGKYKEALQLAKKVLAAFEDILGKKHPATATALNDLGFLHNQMGNHVAARPHLERALAIRREAFGENHLHTATSLNNLGLVFHAMADYETARRYVERALAINQQIHGEEHAETANSLNMLGNLLVAMGDYTAARPYLERALEIRRKVHGEQHSRTAVSLEGLAQMLNQMGHYAAARPYYEQALQIRRKVYGELHPETAKAFNNLGKLLHEMGEHAAARVKYERALAIQREVLGENHPETATCLDGLGVLLTDVGDYDNARRHLERALEIRKERLGDRHTHTARSLNNLGVLLNDEGDYAAARLHFEQVLAIKREALGRHPDTALVLHNLGELLRKMGSYRAAQTYYEQALAIQKEALGLEHPHTAVTLMALGNLQYSLGDYAAARSYVERALAIRRDVLGEAHAETAESLNNLGVVLREAGDYASARTHLERALAIQTDVLGEEHPETALTLGNMGVVLKGQGDYTAARHYYARSLEIRRNVLSESHPDTAHSLMSLAVLHVLLKEYQQAAAKSEEARQVARRHVGRILPGLAEQEQLTFLKVADKESFHSCLTLALLQQHDPIIARLSAGWLLNGKAVAAESLAARTLLMRRQNSPSAANLARKLLAIRTQLASLSLKAVLPQRREMHHKQLAALEAEEHRLSRELGQLGVHAARPKLWIALDDVRQALPRDAVLIEMSRFEINDFEVNGRRNNKKWLPAHYAAWIIPPANQGEIQIVDLGKADEIDGAIQAARAAIGDAPKIIQNEGEPEAQKVVSSLHEKLAARILHPLLAGRGEVKQLVLSPDASLWLVPWGALPLHDGSYCIEKFAIRYVVSGRHLVGRSARNDAPSVPVILADPDFDLHLAKPDRRAAPDRRLRSSGSLANLPRVDRLPNTAAEARAITPTLERYTRLKPEVYLRDRASEGAFKSVRRPAALVLSTHGFFLEDQHVEAMPMGVGGEPTRSAARTTKDKSLENPLLRCGLLLAGCNNRSGVKGHANDGVLTGLEIVGSDLQGTELVVLSACETGIGRVQNGEGVAGLRQAFHLAGAQSVVSTLWQIPDRETARLMNAFFKNLSTGMQDADALRQAQLERIQSRRERHGAAHPFFWAAFTLTGRP